MLSNVANGVAPNDAVNVAQMQNAVVTGNPYIGGYGSGVAAKSTSFGSVAIGLGSVANTPNVISVGDSSQNLTRRITNVSAGINPSDAATVGQLNQTSTNMLSAVNNLETSTQTALKAVNNQLVASSQPALLGATGAVGASDTSNPWVQVGGASDGSDPAYATALTGSVAIGTAATATVGAGVAIGAQALSMGTGSIAVGSGATSTGTGAFALGTQSTATGSQATALGYGAAATGQTSNAFGNGALATGYGDERGQRCTERRKR